MFRALNIWLPAYLRRHPRPVAAGITDVMIAICDHFEPLHKADKATALMRLRRWQNEYPPLIAKFRDADGIRPRHTFFYPIEQYNTDIVTELARLCERCGGETELHLHHDHDNAEQLRDKIQRGKTDLAHHGLLSRTTDGDVRYGFIHGDWALANAHPHGRHCGVNNELDVLLETGCYADFTLPAAPDPSQTRIINSIYYASSTGQPRPHDMGDLAAVRIASITPSPSRLLLVQGPLGLNWSRRKFGILPRIENGEITGPNPPRPDRLKIWLDLGIHVQGRPEWIFIKLHTHGGVERDMATLLTERMENFFQHLVTNCNDGQAFRLHFVTAREMVNIIHAAEAGHTGNPGELRNYRYLRADKCV